MNGLPKMIFDMRGHIPSKADYVRVLWLKYNYNKPKIIVFDGNAATQEAILLKRG